MLRVTFEILPGGSEERKRVIGLMELALIKLHPNGMADYAVAMTKCPPFKGALKAAWRKGGVMSDGEAINRAIAGEDEELIVALAEGHHRTRRGCYDLLLRALKACGMEARQ
ncbi:MAG: hypothetical protein FJX45_18125 [Alphaproteobacteria bacterium]|nr:hypothetical protein [Alphaproteobacteria bacterium]MBM3654451.1 hypothetical protein [Alphaproteobacteria bacterium]